MTETVRAVLGIDAAWTLSQPSGIALIADDGVQWRLVKASASYGAFLEDVPTIDVSRHRGSVPNADALVEAAERTLNSSLTLVAVDMPLSREPIVGKREFLYAFLS